MRESNAMGSLGRTIEDASWDTTLVLRSAHSSGHLDGCKFHSTGQRRRRGSGWIGGGVIRSMYHHQRVISIVDGPITPIGACTPSTLDDKFGQCQRKNR